MNLSDPAHLPSLTLILGGQRSGKSAVAEQLIGAKGLYVATYEPSHGPNDGEMNARIKAHRVRRGNGWQTLEAPFDLTTALGETSCQAPVLIDSLGLWVANRLENGFDDFDGLAEGDALARALLDHPAPVVVVSEQVGMGVIPENAIARKFVDALGHVNQSVAAVAGRVVMVSAGISQIIKQESHISR